MPQCLSAAVPLSEMQDSGEKSLFSQFLEEVIIYSRTGCVRDLPDELRTGEIVMGLYTNDLDSDEAFGLNRSLRRNSPMGDSPRNLSEQEKKMFEWIKETEELVKDTKAKRK